jgi:hypothetical protein
MTIPTPSLDTARSKQFLVTEQTVLQPNDKFAVMPIFLFQRMKNLNTNNDWMQWASFGVRPEVFLTKHLSLTGDCGFDHTHLPGSYDGWLRKCTFAPQIGADRKFFGRPVLRVFVTYANWSNGFRGLVGGVHWPRQLRHLCRACLQGSRDQSSIPRRPSFLFSARRKRPRLRPVGSLARAVRYLPANRHYACLHPSRRCTGRVSRRRQLRHWWLLAHMAALHPAGKHASIPQRRDCAR